MASRPQQYKYSQTSMRICSKYHLLPYLAESKLHKGTKTSKKSLLKNTRVHFSTTTGINWIFQATSLPNTITYLGDFYKAITPRCLYLGNNLSPATLIETTKPFMKKWKEVNCR